MQFLIGRDQLLKREGPIAPTGIRQYPHVRATQSLRLRSPRHHFLPRQRGIRSLAEKRHITRRIAADLLFKAQSRRGEFLRRQLICPRRRPLDHRRQAAAKLQDALIVLRLHLMRRKPGQMQGAPEAIPASGKMMPLRRRE